MENINNINNDNAVHKILGVAKNAPINEIKKKYKELVKIFHPDKYKGSKSYANLQFSKIDNAYKTMISPEYQKTKNFSYQRGVFIPKCQTLRRRQQMGRQQMGRQQMARQQMGRQHMGRNQMGRQNNCINSEIQSFHQNNQNGPQMLCNGTVLFSGNFHPSNMSYETLKKMRENIV